MKNILVVLGTRPEAIKLAPVILKLRDSGKYTVTVCNTEQQKELSNQTLSFFNIEADIKLDVMTPNQTLAVLQAKLLQKMNDVFDMGNYDATIVQGDTMTVFAASLTSFYKKVPVFHVEAGLRSYDLFEPFPEEAIRQMVSRIASLHFCPTTKSQNALQKECLVQKNIINTGNTVIDALSCIGKDVLEQSKRDLCTRGVDFGRPIVLITAHRRENHGERLSVIIRAIKSLAQKYSDVQFVIPVHPNPNVKTRVESALSEVNNILLMPPLPYPELVILMSSAKLIMTDSGGIQEEAPTFRTPLLVLRYETERIEGVEAGVAKLVGADFDSILTNAASVLDLPSWESSRVNACNPYGDGLASCRIKEAIDEYFSI